MKQRQSSMITTQMGLINGGSREPRQKATVDTPICCTLSSEQPSIRNSMSSPQESRELNCVDTIKANESGKIATERRLSSPTKHSRAASGHPNTSHEANSVNNTVNKCGISVAKFLSPTRSHVSRHIKPLFANRGDKHIQQKSIQPKSIESSEFDSVGDDYSGSAIGLYEVPIAIKQMDHDRLNHKNNVEQVIIRAVEEQQINSAPLDGTAHIWKASRKSECLASADSLQVDELVAQEENWHTIRKTSNSNANSKVINSGKTFKIERKSSRPVRTTSKVMTKATTTNSTATANSNSAVCLQEKFGSSMQSDAEKVKNVQVVNNIRPINLKRTESVVSSMTIKQSYSSLVALTNSTAAKIVPGARKIIHQQKLNNINNDRRSSRNSSLKSSAGDQNSKATLQQNSQQQYQSQKSFKGVRKQKSRALLQHNIQAQQVTNSSNTLMIDTSCRRKSDVQQKSRETDGGSIISQENIHKSQKQPDNVFKVEGSSVSSTGSSSTIQVLQCSKNLRNSNGVLQQRQNITPDQHQKQLQQQQQQKTDVGHSSQTSLTCLKDTSYLQGVLQQQKFRKLSSKKRNSSSKKFSINSKQQQEYATCNIVGSRSSNLSKSNSKGNIAPKTTSTIAPSSSGKSMIPLAYQTQSLSLRNFVETHQARIKQQQQQTTHTQTQQPPCPDGQQRNNLNVIKKSMVDKQRSIKNFNGVQEPKTTRRQRHQMVVACPPDTSLVLSADLLQQQLQSIELDDSEKVIQKRAILRNRRSQEHCGFASRRPIPVTIEDHVADCNDDTPPDVGERHLLSNRSRTSTNSNNFSAKQCKKLKKEAVGGIRNLLKKSKSQTRTNKRHSQKPLYFSSQDEENNQEQHSDKTVEINDKESSSLAENLFRKQEDPFRDAAAVLNKGDGYSTGKEKSKIVGATTSAIAQEQKTHLLLLNSGVPIQPKEESSCFETSMKNTESHVVIPKLDDLKATYNNSSSNGRLLTADPTKQAAAVSSSRSSAKPDDLKSKLVQPLQNDGTSSQYKQQQQQSRTSHVTPYVPEKLNLVTQRRNRRSRMGRSSLISHNNKLQQQSSMVSTPVVIVNLENSTKRSNAGGSSSNQQLSSIMQTGGFDEQNQLVIQQFYQTDEVRQQQEQQQQSTSAEQNDISKNHHLSFADIAAESCQGGMMQTNNLHKDMYDDDDDSSCQERSLKIPDKTVDNDNRKNEAEEVLEQQSSQQKIEILLPLQENCQQEIFNISKAEQMHQDSGDHDDFVYTQANFDDILESLDQEISTTKQSSPSRLQQKTPKTRDGGLIEPVRVSMPTSFRGSIVIQPLDEEQKQQEKQFQTVDASRVSRKEDQHRQILKKSRSQVRQPQNIITTAPVVAAYDDNDNDKTVVSKQIMQLRRNQNDCFSPSNHLQRSQHKGKPDFKVQMRGRNNHNHNPQPSDQETKNTTAHHHQRNYQTVSKTIVTRGRFENPSRGSCTDTSGLVKSHSQVNVKNGVSQAVSASRQRVKRKLFPPHQLQQQYQTVQHLDCSLTPRKQDENSCGQQTSTLRISHRPSTISQQKLMRKQRSQDRGSQYADNISQGATTSQNLRSPGQKSQRSMSTLSVHQTKKFVLRSTKKLTHFVEFAITPSSKDATGCGNSSNTFISPLKLKMIEKRHGLQLVFNETKSRGSQDKQQQQHQDNGTEQQIELDQDGPSAVELDFSNQIPAKQPLMMMPVADVSEKDKALLSNNDAMDSYVRDLCEKYL